MVDAGYMFDYYEPSGMTPFTVNYDGKHRRIYESGTSCDSSLKSVPYSAMDSNSYQSLLSLRSSTIPPKDCVSLRAFSTTISSTGSVSGYHSSIGSTVPSTGSRGISGEPVLSSPIPIYTLQSRRKRESEFFQAEYLPVEIWRADRQFAEWGPPSDRPYYQVEWLRVSRGRYPAALVDSLFESSDCTTPTPISPSSTPSATPSANRTTTDYESCTTVMATDAIEEEWARNVHALSRELDGWSTSSSVVSPLSSDLSSIDLSTPTITTACSLDAWDCETQNGEDTDPPVPSRSVLRGIYDLLAAIFCSRRKEEKAVKNGEVKMDRGY
ncbi:hypothetical protein PMAYCL1PPCAC_28919, partial [Pristionchus mayeri]